MREDLGGRSALTATLHSSPGTLAFLLGSGVSHAAGLRTSWEVVQDLIREVARSEGAEEDLGGDPEEWWEREHGVAARYDQVVPALARTDAVRQRLLRPYFESTPTGERAEPTEAHRVIARLAARGRVSVLVTTNLDRLLERALEEVGVAPQVIASPQGVHGMTPLVHAGVTVIKLHGDYGNVGQRHTAEELAEYPAEFTPLLARVFDEYGLLTLGWSAEWDAALVETLRASPSRRYPLFWAARGDGLGDAAKSIIAARQGHVIRIVDADELMTDVEQRLDRLITVAARRVEPTVLRSYSMQPDYSSPTTGWTTLPLVVLRSAAFLATRTGVEMGIIRPRHRERMLDAITRADLTRSLYLLSERQAVPAEDGHQLVDRPISGPWHVPQEVRQTTDTATFRFGRGGEAGVCAVVRFDLPRMGTGGVRLTVDIGVSLAEKLRLDDVARLLRDGVVLIANDLLVALADLLADDALLTVVEGHVLASPMDGRGGSRHNNLETHIDWSGLGTGTGDVGAQAGFAVRVGEMPTTELASLVVAEGLDYTALALGFIDPRSGINLLRRSLGIAPVDDG